MNILLISIGTRGDCEPFVGVAQMLKQRGENVMISLPEQYVPLAEGVGLDCCSLGADFLDLMDGADAQRVMSSGGMKLRNLPSFWRMWKASKSIQEDLTNRQAAIIDQFAPDRIIFHFKATYVIPYSIISSTKCIILATTPAVIHPFEGLSVVGVNRDLGERMNRLSYKLVNWANSRAIMLAVHQKYKGKIKQSEVSAALLNTKIAYNVSSNIVKGEEQLPDNAMFAGFWDIKKKMNYTPESELVEFIDRHKKILFVTFGSMRNSKPKENTETILKILEQSNIPALINISAGGLLKPEVYNKELFYFVESIPYDYVFPKVYGVIHHGGAGTTQNSIKYGCATMVIPHTADQPMWDMIVERLGVGCKGISISKLTPDRFRSKVIELYENSLYKKQSEQLSQQISLEENEDKLYQFIKD